MRLFCALLGRKAKLRIDGLRSGVLFVRLEEDAGDDEEEERPRGGRISREKG